MTRKVGISETGMAIGDDGGRAPVAQEQEDHQRRQRHPLEHGVKRGLEARAGVVDRREDLGEADVRVLLPAA